MNFHIGKIYEREDEYRFIVSSPAGERGFKAKTKKAAVKARGKMISKIKELCTDKDKLYM